MTAPLYILHLMLQIQLAEWLTHASVKAEGGTNGSLSKMQDKNPCRKGATFVSNGLCLGKGYREHDPPNRVGTKVLLRYVNPDIVDIKQEERTITLSIQINKVWNDDRIKLSPSSTWSFGYYGARGIYIPWYQVNSMLRPPIWYPDGIDMENIASENVIEMHEPFTHLLLATGGSYIRAFELWLSKHQWPIFDPNATGLIVRTDLRVTIPCDFDATMFPFDPQDCKFRHSNEAATNLIPIFQLSMKPNMTKKNSKHGFTITRFLDNGTSRNDHDKTYSYVGIKFKIARILGPFVYQYYLPSAAIVFVSQISFIIPSSATPGRVGLLATLFLTLINLFINHMVRVAQSKPIYFVSYKL